MRVLGGVVYSRRWSGRYSLHAYSSPHIPPVDSCARNHEIRDPDGTTHKIPCDRDKIGPIVWTLLKSKLEDLGRADGGSLEEYRLWTSLVAHFMRDLPIPDEFSANVPSTVEEFLRLYRCVWGGHYQVNPPIPAHTAFVRLFLAPHNYRFKTAKDEEGKTGSGLSPLMMASISGNVEVVRALIAEHKVDVTTQLRDTNTVIGFEPGVTALHMAMACASTGHEDMLTLHLNAGADINAPSKSGL